MPPKRRTQNTPCLGLIMLSLTLTASQAVEIEHTDLQTTPVTQSSETRIEQEKMGYWQLSVDEWQRYQSLMQGMRGAVSQPTISPLEVLGIHARTTEERTYYAERWAQMMFQDTEQVLAFQQAYDTAFKKLFGDVPIVDPITSHQASSLPRLQAGDRLLYFTDTQCAACNQGLKQLIQAQQHDRREIAIDIYLIDTSADLLGDQQARTWASEQAIPPALVTTRQVTINHANGLHHEHLSPEDTLPAIVIQYANGTHQRHPNPIMVQP